MPRGLTIIELLTCLLLAAVTLHLALPGFQDLLAGQRATAASNAVAGAVALARSSAIVGRKVVVLCPNADGACGGRSHWHGGGLIFADRNGNAQFDDGEHLYGVLPPLPTGAKLYWRSFRNRSYLRFLPTGFTAWQNGHFQYCPPDADPRFSRLLIINAQGRVRSAPDRDGDGVREGADGEPLVCP